MSHRKPHDGRSPALIILLVILHVFTVALLVRKLAVGHWGHFGLCLLCLGLYSLPALLSHVFHADLPPLLYAAAACFAAAANLGGEVFGFYLRFPFWDSALHFIWGILAAVIGYALPDLLGRREGVTRGMPKAAVVLLSVSFAMLAAVLWELIEFAVDLWFHTDMQKDSWVTAIHSVLLQPDGLNQAQHVEIADLVVNGDHWPAYLDIGLRDTMSDLLWTLAGAVPGSLLTLTDHRGSVGSRILRSLMPRPRRSSKVKNGAETI